MKAFKILMENSWVIRSKDRSLYGEIKREVSKNKKFISESLGWRLIINDRIIKIEKIPSNAKSFMGISEFTNIRDYCMLCVLLNFLEDKDEEEQFLLSEIVAKIELDLKKDINIDFTNFSHRNSLIRVLNFASAKGMLIEYEKEFDLSHKIGEEILYENTGLSRYFATNFEYIIEDFNSYKDFEKKQFEDLESEKGHLRTNRVYRNLVCTPMVHWDNGNNADAVYIKNHRQWISKNLSNIIGGELHLHKNSAFFLANETENFGSLHPNSKIVSEIIASICSEIRIMIEDNKLNLDYSDCTEMTLEDFDKIILSCVEKNKDLWTKEYKSMKFEKLKSEIIEYMTSWMFISYEDKVKIYPSVGKITGYYINDL